MIKVGLASVSFPTTTLAFEMQSNGKGKFCWRVQARAKVEVVRTVDVCYSFEFYPIRRFSKAMRLFALVNPNSGVVESFFWP